MLQPSQSMAKGQLWLLALAALLAYMPVYADNTKTCYNNKGSEMSAGYAACNPNALESNSVHSSCCNIGDPRGSNSDICLNSGLCLWQASNVSFYFMFANGCTDSTGKDPACQQVCTGRDAASYTIKPCSSGQWCCQDIASPLTDCCNDAFSLPGGHIGFVDFYDSYGPTTASNSSATSSTSTGTSTSGPTTSTNPASSSCAPVNNSHVGAIAGGVVAGVLGLLLVGALIALFLMHRKYKYYHRMSTGGDDNSSGLFARKQPVPPTPPEVPAVVKPYYAHAPPNPALEMDARQPRVELG